MDKNLVGHRNKPRVTTEKGISARITEIMSFNTKYFSVDLLLKYLARLGTRVSFEFLDADVA